MCLRVNPFQQLLVDGSVKQGSASQRLSSDYTFQSCVHSGSGHFPICFASPTACAQQLCLCCVVYSHVPGVHTPDPDAPGPLRGHSSVLHLNRYMVVIGGLWSVPLARGPAARTFPRPTVLPLQGIVCRGLGIVNESQAQQGPLLAHHRCPLAVQCGCGCMCRILRVYFFFSKDVYVLCPCDGSFLNFGLRVLTKAQTLSSTHFSGSRTHLCSSACGTWCVSVGVGVCNLDVGVDVCVGAVCGCGCGCGCSMFVRLWVCSRKYTALEHRNSRHW